MLVHMIERAKSTARVASGSIAGAMRWTLTPDPRIVALSLRWALALLVLFVAVYGTTNWLAAQRADRLRLWFDWELRIALVPWMVWAYLSLAASFFLPMWVMDAAHIERLCKRLALATVASAVCFVLFPTELGYARASLVPQYDLAYRVIHRLDLPHNLAPSLHVSWSAILLLSLRQVSRRWLRRAFESWFALLVVSVVFTHQHHVLDVLGGMLVALLCYRAVRSNGAGLTRSGRTP